MSDVIESVQQDILEAIDKDRLVLPTLPEVALQVREAATDDNIDIPKLCEVITRDAALAARIIKVSNSPLLRASREILDLKMAVNRLGINYTANLATGLAMEQMFQATSDVVDQHLRATWAASTEVAGICHVLARNYTKLKPDQATLAGLTHKIGVLPILTYAEEHRSLLKQADVLDKIIDAAHAKIGHRILEAWDFPEEMRIVPEECENFGRVVDKVDYADVVMVAMLQSLDSNHPYAQMDWNKISAFERLGLSHNDNDLEVEDLSAEMEAAMSFLQ